MSAALLPVVTPAYPASFPSLMRARAVAVLVAADTLAGPYVDSSRATPVKPEDAPRILVYAGESTRAPLGGSPPSYRMVLDVIIVGIVQHAQLAGCEALADAIAYQIETAIATSTSFMAAPLEMLSEMNTTMKISAEGDRYEGQAIVTVKCQTTDVFAPNLSPFAPLAEIDLTVVAPNGDVQIGAIIPF